MALTHAQEWALTLETASACNLLRSGDVALRSTEATVDAWDSILTSLSIGVEKTLKVSLGLGDLAATGSWTSSRVMKRTYRHDITAMWSTLQARLGGVLQGHPYPAWLLEQVHRDPILPATLEALNRYANEGRFYFLDELSDLAQTGESPLTAWLTAEQVALQTGGDRLLTALGPTADDDAQAQVWFDVRPRELIADALAAWSLAIAVCGLHGAFGDRGKRFGTALRHSRPLPDMRIGAETSAIDRGEG